MMKAVRHMKLKTKAFDFCQDQALKKSLDELNNN